MKTFGRIAGAAAASLALVLAPVGVASAASVAPAAPVDRRDDDRVSVTLTAEQRTAVLGARSAYLTTAAGVRTTYLDAVEGALKAARVTTQPALLAYEIAKDAYAFTRATGGDATAAKTALDNAAAAYKAALQTARTAVEDCGRQREGRCSHCAGEGAHRLRRRGHRSRAERAAGPARAAGPRQELDQPGIREGLRAGLGSECAPLTWCGR